MPNTEIGRVSQLPPTHPGEILREDVLPELRLTVTDAAVKLGVSRQTLHRILSGEAAVTADRPPITASEDFARFLEHIPGCFAFVGNGEDSAPLHNARFDFADSGLVPGARYLAEVAKMRARPERA